MRNLLIFFILSSVSLILALPDPEDPDTSDAVVVRNADADTAAATDVNTRLFTGNQQQDNVIAAGVVGLGLGVGGVLLTQALLDSEKKSKCYEYCNPYGGGHHRYKRDDGGLGRLFGLGGGGGNNYGHRDCHCPPRRPHGDSGYRGPQHGGGYQQPSPPYHHQQQHHSSAYRPPTSSAYHRPEPYRPAKPSGYRPPSSDYRDPHAYREPEPYRPPATRPPVYHTTKPPTYYQPTTRPPIYYRPTTRPPIYHQPATQRPPYYNDQYSPFSGRSLPTGEEDKVDVKGVEPRTNGDVKDVDNVSKPSSSRVRFGEKK